MDPADQPHQPDPRAGRPDPAQPVRAARPASPLSARFAFVQLEVPWSLGPPDGRYVLRDDERSPITHVVVVATLGAPERRRRGRIARPRRQGAAPEPEPAPVSTGRATVIEVLSPFTDERAASRWLRGAGEDDLARGLRTLRGVLRAHRLVSADPGVPEVGRDRLLAARIGFGAGEQVADGRWEQARELAPRPAAHGRRRPPEGQERLAAVLGGRARMLACEELVLRARSDLDADCPREAALQTTVALDAALAELGSEPTAGILSERLAELRADREPVAAAAQQALSTEPDGDSLQAVADAVSRLQAVLRAHATGTGHASA